LFDTRPSTRPAKRAALFDSKDGIVKSHKGARDFFTSGNWMDMSNEWIRLPIKKLENVEQQFEAITVSSIRKISFVAPFAS
jgi:hypothetical protein